MRRSGKVIHVACSWDSRNAVFSMTLRWLSDGERSVLLYTLDEMSLDGYCTSFVLPLSSVCLLLLHARLDTLYNLRSIYTFWRFAALEHYLLVPRHFVFGHAN